MTTAEPGLAVAQFPEEVHCLSGRLGLFRNENKPAADLVQRSWKSVEKSPLQNLN